MHLALVRLVIETQDVKEAVQGQDLELAVERVRETLRVAARGFDADDHIAETHVRALARERQHVGRLVLEPKVAIEPSQQGIPGEYDRQFSADLQGRGCALENGADCLGPNRVPSLAIHEEDRQLLRRAIPEPRRRDPASQTAATRRFAFHDAPPFDEPGEAALDPPFCGPRPS